MDSKVESIIAALDKLTERVEILEKRLDELAESKTDTELLVIKEDMDSLRIDIEDELDELQNRLDYLEANL